METLAAAPSARLPRDVVRAEVSRLADAAVLPVAIGALSYAAVAQGGFYRAPGSLVAVVLAGLALASTRGTGGTAPLLAAGVLLASGVGAAGLVSGWGPNTPQIVAALGAAIAVVPVTRHVIERGERARLLDAVSWIGAGTAAVGIVGVALHRAPWAMPAGGLWRASSTLTYANAAGSLFLLALGASAYALAGRATLPRRLAAFVTLTGLAATLSRGAFIGGAVALAVLATRRRAGVLRPMRAPALGAAIAFAFLVPSIAGAARPELAAAGIALGCAVAIRRGGTARAAAAGRLRLLGVLGVVAILAAVAAPAGWSRVYAARALPASETRLRTWASAWDLAAATPAFGRGPGTFSILEEDPVRGPVLIRYVHNEYLQAFYETGLVGVASLLGAIAILAAWMRRSRRHEGGRQALAVALCAAFAVHSGFDFLWRFPLLVAIAFVWLAVAVTPPPEGEEEL